MTDGERTKIVVGVALLLVGSVIVLGLLSGFGVPPILGAAAMILMAGGALLVGVTGIEGSPV